MIVKCEKCGGNVDVARLDTAGREVQLAWVFTLHTSPIEARVCTECGNVELFATQPHEVTGAEVTPEATLTAFDE